jgi:hypothetical protein
MVFFNKAFPYPVIGQAFHFQDIPKKLQQFFFNGFPFFSDTAYKGPEFDLKSALLYLSEVYALFLQGETFFKFKKHHPVGINLQFHLCSGIFL